MLLITLKLKTTILRIKLASKCKLTMEKRENKYIYQKMKDNKLTQTLRPPLARTYSLVAALPFA